MKIKLESILMFLLLLIIIQGQDSCLQYNNTICIQCKEHYSACNQTYCCQNSCIGWDGVGNCMTCADAFTRN